VPVLLLNDGPVSQLIQYMEHPNLGRFVTPRNTDRIEDWSALGRPWACDNDRFNAAYSERRFLRMCRRIAPGADGRPLPGCLFVTVPDTVGDAAATLAEFEHWYPMLGAGRPFRLPLALVLQNGREHLPVPWTKLAAVFIGGDTAWKLGEAAARIVEQAKQRGKHVHMGRVNSEKRIRYAAEIGWDSIDGTGYSRFRAKRLPRGLTVAADPRPPRRYRLDI
jgi:hypothetical protein